ncbi:hypothetical protein Glove_465g9 [Diversispora epigaea]|uniref:Uncharacterized protein n=1 Tax=Diversispora epigaea TaxID=1348612 RepID=A0A397GVJ3_9GLOM|nr:hypothetical protein Glove_465g9 [Diversispora epigaea]
MYTNLEEFFISKLEYAKWIKEFQKIKTPLLNWPEEQEVRKIQPANLTINRNPIHDKTERLEKEWTPSDHILSVHHLSRRIVSQKYLELHRIKYPDQPIPLIYRPSNGQKKKYLTGIWDLGYAMTVHTSQRMTLEAPQQVWVIDEHLVWDTLIYFAIEGPPLLSEIEEARNKKAIEQYLKLFISGKLVGYMNQDKKKDHEFNLSEWDVAIDLDQWTVNRINNDLGHIEGNVRLTCLECN